MADAHDSKSCTERYEGSTPSSGTTTLSVVFGTLSVPLLGLYLRFCCNVMGVVGFEFF